MDCRQLLDQLSEFIDGELDARLCEEFEEHLRGCDPCKVVVDKVLGTIKLYRASQPYPLPASFSEKLHTVLRERWRQRFPSKK